MQIAGGGGRKTDSYSGGPTRWVTHGLPRLSVRMETFSLAKRPRCVQLSGRPLLAKETRISVCIESVTPPLLLSFWLPVPRYACFQKNWYFIIAGTWFCVSTGLPPAHPIVFGGRGVVDSHWGISVSVGLCAGTTPSGLWTENRSRP